MVLLLLSTMVSAQDSSVIVEDITIQHVSTVQASRGERVRLFARRYHSESADRGAVIVLSSDALPADAGLGLDLEDYNYLHHLAGLGFDVFAVDLTGYGLSPKPTMNDGCNADNATQVALLAPTPLYIPCAPVYPWRLTSLFSDWDEVGTIVDSVRELTGDDRVTLIGWSLGAARAAGYAARSPDAVESLVLIAPRYAADAPAELPEGRPDGSSLEVHHVDTVVSEWQEAVQCEGWADFGAVAEQVQREVNEFDPVAAQWGEFPLPGGLFRSPGVVGLTGFNSAAVGRIGVPTLVVRGLDDPWGGDAEALHRDLVVDDRLRLDIACGTHWLIWERSRGALRDALAEYLQSGTVEGQSSGVVRLEATE
jgi:pimeloyl-ACP methyl ester carboxylesterase